MKKLKNKKFIEMMVVGLLVLAAAITGIYFIPDEKLADILLTIFAALISGSLTLSGVAWTIRKSNNDRREEESKKAVPWVSLLSGIDYDMIQTPAIKKDFIEIDLELDMSIGANNPAVVCWGAFVNSDNSNVYIKAIYAENGEKTEEFSQNIIIKNQRFLLLMKSYLAEYPKSFILVVEDIFKREYFYGLQCSDKILFKTDFKTLNIKSFMSINKSEFDETIERWKRKYNKGWI